MRVASDSAESRNPCSLIRMANLYANICQVGQIDDTIEQMYCDMQTLIHETGGSIIPAHLNYVDAAADYVKGRIYVPLNNFGGAESAPLLWRDDA